MQKRILTILLIFALILTMSGGIFSSALTVRAEELTYSNVLDDLQKDPTFDAATFPDKPDDVSVQLIQIAESDGGQLFLYVYQPADSKIDLKCTSVSISVGFSSNGQGLDPKLYDLILVSSEGVFDKYLVNGFALPDEAYRYYNIVSLYREFNSAVDKITDVETSEKAYSVGQQWCVYYLNDELVYEVSSFETVELNILLAGNIICNDGFKWIDVIGKDVSYQSHFIVFDCDDYIISRIFDADLTFLTRYKEYYAQKLSGGTVTNITYPNGEEFIPHYVTITDTEQVVISGGGLLSKTYDFKRIMSGKEFKQNIVDDKIEFDESSIENISDTSWVFSFYETDYVKQTINNYYDHYKVYEVEGVTTLRLHFMDITGKTYDLGVVSDKVSTNEILGNQNGLDTEKFMDLFYKILALIGIIVILILLFIAFPVIKAVFSGFVFILKMLWDLLTLPFRWIFKK